MDIVKKIKELKKLLKIIDIDKKNFFLIFLLVINSL